MEMWFQIKTNTPKRWGKLLTAIFKTGDIPHKTTLSGAGQHVELDWNDFHLQYNKIEPKEQGKNWKLYFLTDNH